MLAKLSLGTLGLSLGGLLTLIGFYAYFSDYATLNLAGFFYGIPLLLGGLALKAAELKPVPWTHPTSDDILELREKQATEIQNQIRKDITRYRYGQDAHLDDSLERFGLNPSDEARPVLVGLREENVEGCYALILEFDSPQFPLDIWQQKQEKMEKFFGPGISIQFQNTGGNSIDVALIANR